MAGISDPALRLLCNRQGAGLVVTEFTSIHSIVARNRRLHDNENIADFVQYSEEESPRSIQLFGSDLDTLAEAARIVEPFFDIIDYNMGCPAPHITQQMAGAALLSKEDLARRIFRTLVDSVDKPVTLKMRSGPSSTDNRRFLEIARIAEEEGIGMIALHPRTVHQGYSGRADWQQISELKSVSNVPIVGNGDIDTPEKAAAMLEQTGCDYVMIGRGAMGNPMLFRQINQYLRTGRYDQYSIPERIGCFFEYLKMARNHAIKFANIKNHAMNFTRGAFGASQLRHRISSSRSLDDLIAIMNAACG